MEPTEILAGSSSHAVVLISGPPMTGKYDLLLRMVAGCADEAIFISTKNGATRVLDDVQGTDRTFSGERIGLVDCVSRRPASNDLEDNGLVKHVNSPADLTSIGVKFTELASAVQERTETERVCVGLHSISQLVMHTDVERVYKFLQVLTGQIRTAGWVGAAVLDQPAGSDEESSLLQQHFDRVVQTRATDGRREYRVRDRSGTTDWEWF